MTDLRTLLLLRPYFFNASHMLGRTRNESVLVSKKLSALVSNNLRTTGVILVSVIERRAISDSTEFSSESFKSNCLGANFRNEKEIFKEPLLASLKLLN